MDASPLQYRGKADQCNQGSYFHQLSTVPLCNAPSQHTQLRSCFEDSMFPQRKPSKAAGAEATKLPQRTSHTTRAAIQWVLKLSARRFSVPALNVSFQFLRLLKVIKKDLASYRISKRTFLPSSGNVYPFRDLLCAGFASPARFHRGWFCYATPREVPIPSFDFLDGFWFQTDWLTWTLILAQGSGLQPSLSKYT